MPGNGSGVGASGHGDNWVDPEPVLCSPTAIALAGMLDGAQLFDPGYIGYLLTRFVVSPAGDFQHLPLWREVTVQTVAGLDRDYPVPGSSR